AAASTFTTSVAAGVASYQADRDLQPLEFTIRAGLLLAAPAIGGMLGGLRLGRVWHYGLAPTLVTVALLAAWAYVGAALAARSAAHGEAVASWTELPPPGGGQSVPRGGARGRRAP